MKRVYLDNVYGNAVQDRNMKSTLTLNDMMQVKERVKKNVGFKKNNEEENLEYSSFVYRFKH